MQRQCDISLCRRFRYSLTIEWDSTKEIIVFIGLNPSTADETKDDPTIRRMIGFAKSWGAGAITVVNLFAWRATDPRELEQLGSAAIGPHNNITRLTLGRRCVACWGSNEMAMERAAQVFKGHSGLWCLGRNKDGSPKHPLYLKANTKLEPFN